MQAMSTGCSIHVTSFVVIGSPVSEKILMGFTIHGQCVHFGHAT